MQGIGRFIKKSPLRIALLLKHRSAWDDRLAIEELLKLKPLINNKTIAVVGNAASIFDRNDGPEIDSHDVIIRMNRGSIRAPKSQGSRTDILCFACKLTSSEISRFNASHLVYTARKRESIGLSALFSRTEIFFSPRIVSLSIKEKISVKGPSTGIITLHMISTYFTPKTMTLYGFDWMKTKTLYRNDKYTLGHDWDKERELVQSWLAEAGGRRLVQAP